MLLSCFGCGFSVSSEPASTAVSVQSRLLPQRLLCGTTQEEPFWEESTQFTRELALQREVEVEVETVDRGGTFLGTLRVLGGAKCASSVPSPAREARTLTQPTLIAEASLHLQSFSDGKGGCCEITAAELGLAVLMPASDLSTVVSRRKRCLLSALSALVPAGPWIWAWRCCPRGWRSCTRPSIRSASPTASSSPPRKLPRAKSASRRAAVPVDALLPCQCPSASGYADNLLPRTKLTDNWSVAARRKCGLHTALL